jgi:hypothetical protein
MGKNISYHKATASLASEQLYTSAKLDELKSYKKIVHIEAFERTVFYCSVG